MTYSVLLLNNYTGVCVWVVVEGAEDVEEETLFYMWVDGNYSCDCCRRAMFERAVGKKGLDPWEGLCGEEEYTAAMVRLPDGRELPLDTLRYFNADPEYRFRWDIFHEDVNRIKSNLQNVSRKET